jgi:hypothetical protein
LFGKGERRQPQNRSTQHFIRLGTRRRFRQFNAVT